MKLQHQSGEIIAQRYQILNTLGQGGVGITYEAQDLNNGERVALKALSLHRMNDWKVLELFEREAQILSYLHHPAIPSYLDYFQVDTPQDRGFYIVQKLAEGKSLAAWVEDGWKPQESEVKRLATQILEILVYLQQLIPPVIHRDIKPQNIIRSADGQVFLVDFGAVQDTYHNTITGGSTVVGTYGYMAPEQFRGQAVLSTDLYGLGTTLLFLLIGKSPADLPQRQLKINFRPYVHISHHFADWLEKMLEPVIAGRFPAADTALAVLRGEQELSSYLRQKPRRPKYTPIRLTATEERLVVEIPPVWLRSKRSQYLGLVTLIWNGLSLLITWIVMASTSFSLLVSPFINLFRSFGMGVLVSFLLLVTLGTRLEIDSENFRIQYWQLGLGTGKFQGRTEEINQVKLGFRGSPLQGNYIILEVLKRKRRYISIGILLTKSEKEWLVWEINAFLDKIRGKSSVLSSQNLE